jgi:hypothetical protein
VASTVPRAHLRPICAPQRRSPPLGGRSPLQNQLAIQRRSLDSRAARRCGDAQASVAYELPTFANWLPEVEDARKSYRSGMPIDLD